MKRQEEKGNMDHPLMPQHVDRLDSHTPEVPTRPPRSKAVKVKGQRQDGVKDSRCRRAAVPT